MKQWYAAGFALGLLVVFGGLWIYGTAQPREVNGVAPVPSVVSPDESETEERGVAAPAKAAVKPPTTVDPALMPSAAPKTRENSEYSAEMRVVQFSADNTAAAGKPMDMTVVLEYTGTENVTALGVLQRLPEGWRFEEMVGGGELPVVAPNKGARGELTFAWIQPPAFPCSFTYRVTPASVGNAPQSLQGQALFRRMAGELRSAPVVTVFNPAVE